jgi:hypothetical protein
LLTAWLFTTSVLSTSAVQAKRSLAKRIAGKLFLRLNKYQQSVKIFSMVEVGFL